MSRKPKPRLLITQLLSEGRLSHEKIGQLAGCSAKTVARTRKELRQERQGCEAKLEAYEAQFRELMPLADRAAEYVKLAKESDQGMVRLKTLARIDELDSIVTAKDNLRAINTGQGPPVGPMFILPPGSGPAVMTYRHSQQLMKDITPSPEDQERYRKLGSYEILDAEEEAAAESDQEDKT